MSLVSVTTERKVITVLFCDLVGSTALGERLDPEALQSVQQAYFERMRAVVQHFGGTLEKFAGDAVLAVFGAPTLHEDDAQRGVRCALEMRQAVAGLNDTLRSRFGVELDVRIGVQTGEAIVGGGDALATGDVMNTAARLEQAAPPGHVLVGRETMLLTTGAVEYGDAVNVEAKGKADPVRAWTAVRVHAGERRVRSPLVGRAGELELLAETLERAIARHEPETVVVLGEPGIGKSRLAEEFARRASGRADVLRGASLPYGEASTWSPLAGVIRREAGIAETDVDEVAVAKLKEKLAARHAGDELGLLGAQLGALVSRAAVASEQELLWGFGRYLEELVRATPVVVVLDDLHWAGDALLELLQQLLRTISSVQLMVVLQGRPELRERLNELLALEPTTMIALAALSDDESSVLVDNLASALAKSWPKEARDAIVERARGSPLFLEEVAAIADEDAVDAAVPRSLRALIGARLDLFPPDAKEVARAAAVVGDIFWDGAIAALLGTSASTPMLHQLETGGFVHEEAESSLVAERQFRFHHALMREVTYESTPKVERSRFHSRAAEWLVPHAEDRPEFVVSIAHHRERALTLLRDVMPFDVGIPALAEAAVHALRGAAGWLAANAGVTEAVALLRRAVSAAEGDSALKELATAQLAATLARSGAREAVELAEKLLASPATPEVEALASLALAEAGRSRADAATMTEAGSRALEIARSIRAHTVELEALDVVGLADAWSGRLRLAVERRRRAIELARELGDVPRLAWNLAGYNAISLLSMGNVGEAERYAEEAKHLATECGSLRALESVHTVFSFLRRAQDRLEEALQHARLRLEYAERLGEQLWLFNALTVSLAAALIDLERYEEAWDCTERALAISRDVDDRGFEAFARARRVRILLGRDRIEDAAAEAALIVSSSGSFPEVAELRAAQGQPEEAEEIWRGTLEELGSSENRLERAETMIGYARFLASSGRGDEARSMLAEARTLVDGTGAKFHARLIADTAALVAEGLADDSQRPTTQPRITLCFRTRPPGGVEPPHADPK